MADQPMKSNVQVACDLCKLSGRVRPASYDAATVYGQWGFLCEEHFRSHGIGLGVGVGQKLKRSE